MSQSRELLERFVQSVAGGQIPDQDDLQKVAALFDEILAGGDPKKALNLSKPRGRPKGGNWVAEVQVSEMLFAGLSEMEACLEGVSVSRSKWYELKKTYDPVIAYVEFLSTRPNAEQAKQAHVDLMAKLDAITKSK